MAANTPLGKNSVYPDRYAPEVLCAVPRRDSRRLLGIGEPLPFRGEDLWNAWELTWLDNRGKPVVATGLFRVPADSENLIESKSLKLYLNSFSMSRFDSPDEVAAVLVEDLSKIASGKVTAELTMEAPSGTCVFADLPGTCIDTLEVSCDTWQPDPSLLSSTGGAQVTETLHSHLLRSNCPVTDQPDIGSILIRYRGAPIEQGALLRYLASYRCHNDFHEACAERIFMDLKGRCAPEHLTVYARYTRRGGVDINPFRSDFEASPPNLRLWRQ